MQTNYPKLNFPPIRLKTRLNETDKSISVWVASRKTYLILTPEEWVRRHLVEYLTTNCGYLTTQICEEYPVLLNNQPQRADVVVVGKDAKPLLLAECKASEISINSAVLDQAVRYNSVVGAKYILLTNGIKHHCFEFKDGKYIAINHIPQNR